MKRIGASRQIAERIWYHGGRSFVSEIRNEKTDGVCLCTSASANVARRYGNAVTMLCLKEGEVPLLEMHWREWMDCNGALHGDASGSVGLLIRGDGDFDWPVDCMFVLEPAAFEIVGHVWGRALEDDGLPLSHEPEPGERGWEQYVRDILECAPEEALAMLGA